jgi:hypothetical protein
VILKVYKEIEIIVSQRVNILGTGGRVSTEGLQLQTLNITAPDCLHNLKENLNICDEYMLA